MEIVNIITKIAPALQEGEQLVHIDFWNNTAAVTHALVVIFGLLLAVTKIFHYDIGINEDQLAQIAAAVATLGGSLISFLHHACSKTAGFKTLPKEVK